MRIKFTNLPSGRDIKYAIIDASTSGNNELVAAAGAGNKILMLSCLMIAAGAVNVRFEDGADGTALSGQMNLTTNSGFQAGFNEGGWCVTSANTALNLELSGATSVDGFLTYVEIT